MDPARWRSAALRVACLGFALWFVLETYGEDWSRPVLASIASLIRLGFCGATAVFSALASQQRSQPRLGRWLRWYAGTGLITAMQCVGWLVTFVVVAVRSGPHPSLLLRAVAFAIPLWLARPRLSGRVEFQRIDGPGGPGPLAPA